MGRNDPTGDKDQWWLKWHPNKAPGKGRAKSKGGTAGIRKGEIVSPKNNKKRKGGK